MHNTVSMQSNGALRKSTETGNCTRSQISIRKPIWDSGRHREDQTLLMNTRALGLATATSNTGVGTLVMDDSLMRLELREERRTAANLSEREAEVLGGLKQGLAYKQIADQLELSIHTVRNYIRRIYHKLDAHSCTEAVVKYLDHESNILPRQPATQLCAGPALGPRETSALKHTTA
jgi:DNA-binding CsgD family transcriptional regulator